MVFAGQMTQPTVSVINMALMDHIEYANDQINQDITRQTI